MCLIDFARFFSATSNRNIMKYHLKVNVINPCRIPNLSGVSLAPTLGPCLGPHPSRRFQLRGPLQEGWTALHWAVRGSQVKKILDLWGVAPQIIRFTRHLDVGTYAATSAKAIFFNS